MLINTLKWRIEFKTDEIAKEDFPEDVFGNIGHIYGKDKGGRPITCVPVLNSLLSSPDVHHSYNLYGGNQDLKAVFGDVDRFIRCVV